MMIDRPGDDRIVSCDDPATLLDEIQRLRLELAKSHARIAELDGLAHRDCLVNLPNRRSLLTSLGELIARVERYGGPAAMLYVDVDGLKGINDAFGHVVGDRALVEVARLLVQSVRKSDIVARLSGDEFGILLEHADELSAWQTAMRIVETVGEAEFCVDAVCLPLSVAAGVGAIQGTDTPESVLARADREMYRNKGSGARQPPALVPSNSVSA